MTECTEPLDSKPLSPKSLNFPHRLMIVARLVKSIVPLVVALQDVLAFWQVNDVSTFDEWGALALVVM